MNQTVDSPRTVVFVMTGWLSLKQMIIKLSLMRILGVITQILTTGCAVHSSVGDSQPDPLPVPVTWSMWLRAYLERRQELKLLKQRLRKLSDPEKAHLCHRWVAGSYFHNA